MTGPVNNSVPSKALTWNFNTNNYFMPPEMRSGDSYTITENIFTSNPSSIVEQYTSIRSGLGAYGGTGVDGIFDHPLSLCAQADSFIQLTNPLIKTIQAEEMTKRADAIINSIINATLNPTSNNPTSNDPTSNDPTTPETTEPPVGEDPASLTDKCAEAGSNFLGHIFPLTGDVVGGVIGGSIGGAVETSLKWGDKVPILGHIAGAVVGGVGGAVKGAVKGVKKVVKKAKKFVNWLRGK